LETNEEAAMKKVLVTGASSGVGFELTKRLLEAGYQVVTLTRSVIPVDPVVDTARVRGHLLSFECDLADAKSRSIALAKVGDAHDRFDIVFNVAGVSLGAPRMTAQGREIHFEVNTLAPFVVLQELRHLLERGEDRLLVNVSSNAALTVKSFEPALLPRPTAFKKLFGPYALSKLALSQWTHAIAPRLATAQIRAVSVCPGSNKTPMTAGEGMPWWLLPFRHLLFSPPRKGASTIWQAAFERSLAPSGAFLVKGKSTPIPFVERASEVLALVESTAGRK
jgi:NAD(P)-dependent dehydrogenase (short-subunit alcohol dehydrogenase family)